MASLRRLNEGNSALPSVEESGVEFAKSVGVIDAGAAALKALRALPAEKVNGDLQYGGLAHETETVRRRSGARRSDRHCHAGRDSVARRGGECSAHHRNHQPRPTRHFPPDRANPLLYFGPDAEKAGAVYNPGGKLPLPRASNDRRGQYDDARTRALRRRALRYLRNLDKTGTRLAEV